MILEGANKLKEENEYIIYTMNSINAGQYCVVVPKNSTGTYNMLIDVHHKTLFDEVASGTKTKEDLISALSTEYLDIKKNNENGILVLPILKEDDYKSAVNNLDKQKMFDETKKIGAITSELYKKMTESGIEKQRINQKIMIIEKEEEDKKFVTWLKEQMPNYVEGISLTGKEENNAAPTETPQPVADLFGMPTPETTSTVETVTTPVQETTAETATVPNDIFASTPNTETTPSETTSIPETQTTTETSTPATEEKIDIFGVPLEQPAAEVTTPPVQQPVANPEPVTETKVDAPAPAPETPQPVQSVELEGTTTFSPIPNGQEETTTGQDTATTPPEKKNGGFVNLAIILVILIGVTIASIELGKFLYSVYGA